MDGRPPATCDLILQPLSPFGIRQSAPPLLAYLLTDILDICYTEQERALRNFPKGAP